MLFYLNFPLAGPIKRLWNRMMTNAPRS